MDSSIHRLIDSSMRPLLDPKTSSLGTLGVILVASGSILVAWGGPWTPEGTFGGQMFPAGLSVSQWEVGLQTTFGCFLPGKNTRRRWLYVAKTK